MERVLRIQTIASSILVAGESNFFDHVPLSICLCVNACKHRGEKCVYLSPANAVANGTETERAKGTACSYFAEYGVLLVVCIVLVTSLGSVLVTLCMSPLFQVADSWMVPGGLVLCVSTTTTTTTTTAPTAVCSSDWRLSATSLSALVLVSDELSSSSSRRAKILPI